MAHFSLKNIREELTTTSGDIVSYVDEQISTISGGGAGDVTLEMLTTTSGDIIDQIPFYIESVNRTMVGGRLEKYSDTELRWEAYQHYSIGLYNGTYWEAVTPSGLIQSFNDFTTISGISAVIDTNYDVYATYSASDNFTLEFQEWAGATSRYQDPVRFEGVYVYEDTTEGRKKRWLGTIRLYNDSGAKFKDERQYRLIQNAYNKIRKDIGATNSYSSYTGHENIGNTWTVWNNSTSVWQCHFVSDGLSNTDFVANATLVANSSQGISISIGSDGTTPHGNASMAESYGTYYEDVGSAYLSSVFSAGYHYVNPVVKSTQSASPNPRILTRYSATGRDMKSQFQGSVWC